jgi:predicted nucleic acid-binding protein
VAQLIDTSVFIALERQQLNLDLMADSFPEEPVAVAAITASELLAGIYFRDSMMLRVTGDWVRALIT